MASSVYPIKRYEFSLPKEFAGSVEVILTEMAPDIFYFVCYLTIREENTVSYLGALLTHCLPITDGISIG
jgi:hypothetical protein